MIRAKLQAGRGRWVGSLLIAGVAASGLFVQWQAVITSGVNPLDAGQKIAFVVAAFSVTAYNLRTRVIDLMLKLDGTPSRIGQAATTARNCTRRLTNLVVLFTLTALLLGAGGFLSKDLSFAPWYSSVVVGLFAGSTVHFFYILFAFERLERFMLDDAEDKAKQKDAARLFPGSV